MNSLSNKSLLDGPHSDSSLGQPTGPTQMVNRMQNPAGMMLSLTCLVVTAEICVGTNYYNHFCDALTRAGMNQFAQVGMQQPMGQRATPPLPMGANLNQVIATCSIVHIHYTKVCV